MASTANTQLKLNTGATVPAIGFGTWQDKEAQEPAVTAALKAGYRHIDTARIYGTEPVSWKSERSPAVAKHLRRALQLFASMRKLSFPVIAEREPA